MHLSGMPNLQIVPHLQLVVLLSLAHHQIASYWKCYLGEQHCVRTAKADR